MPHDYAFETAGSAIRFGPGCTREVGMDLADLGVGRVMVLTDPTLARLQPVATVLESLEDAHVAFALFDRVHVEPTDGSFREAIRFASEGRFDGFVAVGGGSTIDTAKAANLYSTYPPEDFLDYVNAPIGKGEPVPGPLKPLVAVPTTAGIGSETTGVAIFDYTPVRAKTGIAHRRLKPTLGILDPENTRTLPPTVAKLKAFREDDARLPLVGSLLGTACQPRNERQKLLAPPGGGELRSVEAVPPQQAWCLSWCTVCRPLWRKLDSSGAIAQRWIRTCRWISACWSAIRRPFTDPAIPKPPFSTRPSSSTSTAMSAPMRSASSPAPDPCRRISPASAIPPR